MSRVLVCLSVLFILSIAAQFGDCEDNVTQQPNIECDDKNITLGGDKTRISSLEKLLIPMLKDSGKNNSKIEDTGFGKILQKFKRYVRFILPGTRWCGDGDKARNEGDLGFFDRTDSCCRDHDNCKNDMMAGDTQVNIENNGIFTRSACTCDFAFFKCLEKADSPVANKIGFMYFNILRQQCFQCICPMKDCNLEDETECKDHCTKYKWMDSPNYSKSSFPWFPNWLG
ncbi:PREDICTED: phospholipase A2-like [Vollenhovia emeryi]|uniref:phospholipase A2-like n=1 Tax=Vollenhovia emeryi TaxID=411798 RepID=UPI0005F492E0|nr:PREDICTED: phospholipase A2-like [Vollenhovia emeryi]